MVAMRVLLHKCSSCAKYSLSAKCSCGEEALSAHPPKFSFEDKYALYRRKEKFPDAFQ